MFTIYLYSVGQSQNMLIFSLSIFFFTAELFNHHLHVSGPRDESLHSLQRSSTDVSAGTVIHSSSPHFFDVQSNLPAATDVQTEVLTDSFSSLKRLKYLQDISNVSDWCASICSLLFVFPLLLNVKKSWHWQAGALASLASWVNLLLYLQRYTNTLTLRWLHTLL